MNKNHIHSSIHIGWIEAKIWPGFESNLTFVFPSKLVKILHSKWKSMNQWSKWEKHKKSNLQTILTVWVIQSGFWTKVMAHIIGDVLAFCLWSNRTRLPVCIKFEPRAPQKFMKTRGKWKFKWKKLNRYKNRQLEKVILFSSWYSSWS